MFCHQELKDARFLPWMVRLLSNDLTIVDGLKTIEVIGGDQALQMLEQRLEEENDPDRKLLVTEALQAMKSRFRE